MSDVKITRFLGLNNRRSRRDLAVYGDAPGQFLEAATNVDIDDQNRILRRNGFSRVATLSAGRSIAHFGGRFFFAEDSELRVGTPTINSAVAAIHSSNPVSYAELGGNVFYSDGARIGEIDDDNAERWVNFPVPAAPTAAQIAGSLPAGNYVFRMTYVVAGMEGGACALQTIELTSAGGIRFTLPATPAGVSSIGFYVSGQDGTEPRRFGTVAAGTTTVDVTTVADGRSCVTGGLSPLPAGSLCAVARRLCAFKEECLYLSDPLRPGLMDSIGGYIKFAAPISLVVPAGNGAFVAADKTYWIGEIGTEQMVRRPVFDYGAIAGTAGVIKRDEGDQVFWLSERGLVIGDASGAATNVQEANQALDLSGRGFAAHSKASGRIVVGHGL